MAGNNSIRGDETVTFTDNMSFDGTERGGKMTTNGELWIGSTVAPHVRKGTLVAGSGITITPAAGSITITNSSPSLGGDVVGPASSTDNALVRWDGTTGKLIQNGVTTEDDTGNISQTAAVSGATLSYTLANTSNTASAKAGMIVQVAGGTADDAYYQAAISGGQVWTWGIDNSVSDGFVIAASSTLGTTNAIFINTAGDINVTSGGMTVAGANFSTSRSAVGSTVSITSNNTDNTNTSSSASVPITVAGSSAGDPYVSFTVSGIQGYSLGIDNSVTSPAADPFQLTNSNAGPSVGSPLIVVQSTGEITYPLQSAFLAYVNTTITNVTGDNTLYTIIYDTEVFDQNSDFNLASSTFTAPVTGKYQVNYNSRLGGGTVISNIVCDIVSSNNSFRREASLAAGSTLSGGTTMSILLDMDAADTFVVKIACSDTGGKIDDVTGVAGGLIYNSLSGSLVC